MYQTNERVTIYLCRCQTTVQSPWYCITASIMAYATNMAYLPLVANARPSSRGSRGLSSRSLKLSWRGAEDRMRLFILTEIHGGRRRDVSQRAVAEPEMVKGTVVRDRYSRMDSNIELYPIPFRKSPLDSCPPIYTNIQYNSVHHGPGWPMGYGPGRATGWVWPQILGFQWAPERLGLRAQIKLQFFPH